MAGRSSYSAKGVAPENAPPPVTTDSEPVQTDRPLDGEFESTPVVCPPASSKEFSELHL